MPYRRHVLARVMVHGIRLEGCPHYGRPCSRPASLVIKACEGARVTVTPQSVENEGFELVLLSDEELQLAELPEYIRVQGYRFENRGEQIHIFDQPGDYVI